MIEPEDIPKILVHLREHFLYQAFYRIGYTDEKGSKDMLEAFEKVLKDGNNLSFYAEDEETGKVRICVNIHCLFITKQLYHFSITGCRMSSNYN